MRDEGGRAKNYASGLVAAFVAGGLSVFLALRPDLRSFSAGETSLDFLNALVAGWSVLITFIVIVSALRGHGEESVATVTEYSILFGWTLLAYFGFLARGIL